MDLTMTAGRTSGCHGHVFYILRRRKTVGTSYAQQLLLFSHLKNGKLNEPEQRRQWCSPNLVCSRTRGRRSRRLMAAGCSGNVMDGSLYCCEMFLRTWSWLELRLVEMYQIRVRGTPSAPSFTLPRQLPSAPDVGAAGATFTE